LKFVVLISIIVRKISLKSEPSFPISLTCEDGLVLESRIVASCTVFALVGFRDCETLRYSHCDRR